MPARGPSLATGDRSVIFEFTQIGNSVKVTAIDELTGLEAAVIGPTTAMRRDMERLAAAKLKRALDKRAASKH
jgi:hypothetical protein